MGRYKALKSVGHNIGHSFTSLMNYVDGDYVMGHILRLARRTGSDTLTIDFVAATSTPATLFAEPISKGPARYTEFFWDLVQKHGSDRSCVESAVLKLHYDISVRRPTHHQLESAGSPYTCEVHIRDVHGKDYITKLSGWWYPEKLKPRPWWKFWFRRRK